jgi:uncharacterized protein (DUF1499 family)
MLAICLICAMSLSSCGGKRPRDLGASDAGLAACPASPNCVSSDARDPAHRIEPFALATSPDAAWQVIREEVADLRRTTMVVATEGYLHAECASALFGFVDDLELQLRPSSDLVAVRSASRVGHSDLGANRRRVERLRESLRRRGVVR